MKLLPVNTNSVGEAEIELLIKLDRLARRV